MKVDIENFGRTPNWTMPVGQRATLVRITLKIECDGRGMSGHEVGELCRKIEKIAKGRSKTRKVYAFC